MIKPTILLTLLTALALPVGLHAGNGSVVRSPLQNTGVDADASGSLLSLLQAKSSRFAVELSKLAPRAEYSLQVGALMEARFTTDAQGRARLRFETAAKSGRLALDFDPRGETVAVLDGNGTAVLQAVVSGAGEEEKIAVDERANLIVQDGTRGKAEARYTVGKNGQRAFEVKVSATSATVLHLFVDGLDRGEIAIHNHAGRARFSNQPTSGRLPLDFDPRSAQIDLFGTGEALAFTGKLEALAKGVNFDTRATRSVRIPATAVAPAGSHAEAALRIRADARRDFSVELEDIAAGAYELLVDGVVQGTINVAARASGGTQGELEFSNREDHEGEELPLQFNPVGATLSLRQGTTVFFTGPFNPSAGTKAPTPSGAASQLTEGLASTGLDANAHAEAEFSTQANGETEFEVEVEDLDAGKYQLFVGGTLRGTITAALGTNGQVRGQLKFEKEGAGEDRVAKKGGSDDGGGDDQGSGGQGADDPAGDDHGGGNGGGSGGGGAAKEARLPLNFDPRGQLIEIKSAAGTFFSHVFGDGSAPTTGGGGTAVVPGEISIALLSSGADHDATAHAEWERSDRGRESFEVELEDLAVGSYELLVGGVVKGTINVAATNRGTRGQIEFEDEPGANQLPLDFDPLGQVITVQSGGVIYFQRTFPSGS